MAEWPQLERLAATMGCAAADLGCFGVDDESLELMDAQYGYAARMQNEFDGLVFECPDSEFLGADGRPTCPIPTGEEYIRQVDLDQFSIAQNFGLLAALYVGFHLAGLASFVLLASKQRLS